MTLTLTETPQPSQADLEKEARAAHDEYCMRFLSSPTKNMNEDWQLSRAYSTYWNARERAGMAIDRQMHIFYPPDLVHECGMSGTTINTESILNWMAERCEKEGDVAMASFYRYVACKYFQAEEPGTHEDEPDEEVDEATHEASMKELEEAVRSYHEKLAQSSAEQESSETAH